ncbi:MAG: M28 family peptidase [Clostridia bacterium]|nr:M28 family peptidase [Clostridia bacterium]
MKDFLTEINEKFPIRRSESQKKEFRAYVLDVASQLGQQTNVEQIKNSNNVIIGDVESAEVVFTAHYDTPARSLYPNLMLPRSPFIFYVYNFFFPLLMAGLSLGIALGLDALFTLGNQWTVLIYLWIYFAMFYLAVLTFTNKHNANDNTSGVAVVLSLVEKNLNSNKVAYVLFDNEEKGLIGSTAFSKLHKDWKRNKLFVNLDCVGNGDQILILAKKEAKSHKNFENLTKNVQTNDKFSVHYFPMESSVANSDHKNFDCGVAIVACKKHKFLRFYTSRIHTNLDVVASVENVSFLAEKLSNFSNSL